MPAKDKSKDLSQEYGLFDPKNKNKVAKAAVDSELLDHQQRYDNSIQESEIAPDRADLEEDPSEDKNFTRNFYRYSKSFQDNENGAPGVDDDYGIYENPDEPKLEVDVDDVANEEILTETEENNESKEK